MKAKWKRTRVAEIGPYRCIKLDVNMEPGITETCLSGKWGEIWEKGGPGTGAPYKAVITNARVANKYLGTKLKLGEETVIVFDEEELAEWVRRLKVRIGRFTGQMRSANNFGFQSTPSKSSTLTI